MLVGLLGSGIGVGAAEDTSHGPVSRDLLRHVGLTVVWQGTLPVKPSERINVMTLLDNRLYVRSDRNYVWSLDRNDGNVVFSRAVAPRGFPILGWTAYGDRLICVIDNQLVQLDIDTGLERRVSDLGLSIMAPPIRNSSFFYIGAADRRLHALRTEALVQVFEVAAGNQSLITTVLADDQMVVFGTDEGNLVAVAADGPRKLWEFKAVEAISGPVVRDGDSFFFANKDTNVYRVDMVEPYSVVLAWKQQMEAVLDRSPRVTADVIYQYAFSRGLTAMNKQTGRLLWALPDGVDLLAQAGGKAYVITRNRTMTIMDNATGRKLSSVNFAPVVNHVANTVDAKIYVADTQGRVACFVPVR